MGSPDRTETIALNGKAMRITKNLMFFLRRPRNDPISVSRPVRFWIDALCINQGDNQEKASQIPLMRQIYENALCVHAELGPATKDEELAVEPIRHISKALTERARQSSSSTGASYLDTIMLPYVGPYDADAWAGIYRIFTGQYWRRVWIMQEATSMKSVEFHYGNTVLRMLDMKALHVAYLRLRRSAELAGTDPLKWLHLPGLQRIIDISMLRERKDPPPTLVEVLSHFRGLAATKQHDIAYAAMNLAHDIRSGDIMPDYDKSVSVVFRDVVVFYLKRETPFPLDILAHCGTFLPSVEPPEGFATWMPRWQDLLAQKPFPRFVADGTGGLTRAYDASHSATLKPDLDIAGMSLRVRGFSVDEITQVRYPNLKFNAYDGCVVVSSWAPDDPHGRYLGDKGDETKLQAFLRTVVADYDTRRNIRGCSVEWHVDSFVRDHGPMSHVHTTCHARRLAITTRGYMALVNCQAEIGDKLFVLYGGAMIYVLRPRGDAYILVGECYVHGIMDGEAMELLRDGRATEQAVCIL